MSAGSSNRRHTGVVMNSSVWQEKSARSPAGSRWLSMSVPAGRHVGLVVRIHLRALKQRMY